ncbi:hypothetical protein OG394_39990 [Kribbella sp. NBC_01245]|uniref:hypothetical protein n=1 Tax=Kribbella sp. NBC_01245 TaxID=2903578 RepID=UPI002E2D0AE7|nr:hypothetical protein [Kribbella sp. NBC_01245]
MKRADKIRIGLLVGIPGAVLLVSLAAGLPGWLIGLFAVGSGAVSFGVFRGLGERPDLAIPVIPKAVSAEIVGVALRSADERIRFQFSALVHWNAPMTVRQSHADLAKVAEDSLLTRAAAIAAVYPAAESELAQRRLAATLGQPLESQGLAVWADEVQLTLNERDRKYLDKADTLKQQFDLWLLEVERERATRRYLAEDVLCNKSTAVVWWFARNQKDPGDTVEKVDVLNRLVELVADDSKPLQNGSSTPDLVEALDKVPSEEERHYFAFEIADMWESAGEHAIAEQLRQRYEPDAKVIDIDSVGRTRGSLSYPQAGGSLDAEGGG